MGHNFHGAKAANSLFGNRHASAVKGRGHGHNLRSLVVNLLTGLLTTTLHLTGNLVRIASHIKGRVKGNFKGHLVRSNGRTAALILSAFTACRLLGLADKVHDDGPVDDDKVEGDGDRPVTYRWSLLWVPTVTTHGTMVTYITNEGKLVSPVVFNDATDKCTPFTPRVYGADIDAPVTLPALPGLTAVI